VQVERHAITICVVAHDNVGVAVAIEINGGHRGVWIAHRGAHRAALLRRDASICEGTKNSGGGRKAAQRHEKTQRVCTVGIHDLPLLLEKPSEVRFQPHTREKRKGQLKFLNCSITPTMRTPAQWVAVISTEAGKGPSVTAR
jgi:hypothetical protein